ncbi:MAG TPA: sulfonate ABC transporter substrate-binding protein, partial [Pseudonocardia sp.]
MKRSLRPLALVLIAAAALTACSRADSGGSSAPAAANQGPAAELRLGYFPNITHAPALIGLDKGFFAKELGS